MLQLLTNMNKLLARHPQTRRRHLAWHTPTVVPIWPNVRLMEEEASYSSYGEAYEVHCARYGREPDLPIVQFKRLCCTPSGQIISDPDGSMRLRVHIFHCFPAVCLTGALH